LKGRLQSLDIFRGLTIASMIVVNNSPGAREDAYPWLRHAVWNGWTFADTIFPAFLWIVGVSMMLSMASRMARGADRTTLLLHAVRRSALLFCCGLFLNQFYFPDRHFPFFGFLAQVQVTGVLQKIAVCYLAAFLIVLLWNWRGAIAGIVGLNLAYLGLMLYYPVPGCGAGGLTAECNFAGYLDRTLFNGHLWVNGNPHGQDPDGLGSILPAISTVLFGALAGALLRKKLAPDRLALWIFGMGAGFIVCGGAISAWVIPVNKPLWSTSYAFLMAGLSSATFGLCYWLADMKGWGGWLKPLEIYGMNAVAAYMISSEAANLPKIHWFGVSVYDVCLRVASNPNASLLFALVYTAGVYVPVWWMYRRGWFLKF
jgi:predicted acyltransferase